MTLPLDGITVVSIEQAVAVPFATRHLGDLGARVIKVERPQRGDFARHYDTTVKGLASHFVWLNRNKESIALDLRSPEGIELFRKLIADADVLTYNLSPGALERLGIDIDELCKTHEQLVIAELTGYGPEGPYKDYRAYDMLIQAESGLVAVTGSADAPAKAGIPVADIAAGTYILQAILTALYRRERTGRGGIVRLSLFDSMMEWMGYPLLYTQYQDQQLARRGLGHPTVVPYDAYPTSDGELVIIAVQNERGWQSLVTDVMVAPDLLADPRLSSNVGRCAHREIVDAAIAAFTRTVSAAELIELLRSAGVAGGPVLSVAEAARHPQLTERNRWIPTESGAGEINTLVSPLFPSFGEQPAGRIPECGQDTRAILRELGIAPNGIADLMEKGVVA